MRLILARRPASNSGLKLSIKIDMRRLSRLTIVLVAGIVLSWEYYAVSDPHGTALRLTSLVFWSSGLLLAVLWGPKFLRGTGRFLGDWARTIEFDLDSLQRRLVLGVLLALLVQLGARGGSPIVAWGSYGVFWALLLALVIVSIRRERALRHSDAPVSRLKWMLLITFLLSLPTLALQNGTIHVIGSFGVVVSTLGLLGIFLRWCWRRIGPSRGRSISSHQFE